MISRRTLLTGLLMAPINSIMVPSSAEMGGLSLGVDLLYPLLSDYIGKDTFEGVFAEANPVGRSGVWSRETTSSLEYESTLIDLRQGLVSSQARKILDGKLVDALYNSYGLSEIGSRIENEYLTSRNFLPLTFSFLGFISRKSVTRNVQTNFSSIQSMKALNSSFENLLKRKFQPLVLGNKEDIAGPLFFSSLSLALNSSRFHDSLLAHKVSWNSKQMINVLEQLFQLKRFMNKNVNSTSWKTAHDLVLNGDAITSFGTADFSKEIPVWMANDLALDPLSFPKTNLQARESELIFQGFTFSDELASQSFDLLLTKLASAEFQRRFMFKFPHKLVLSNSGAKPWPGIATDQSRWRSRRLVPVTSLVLSLPFEFLKLSLAPVIRDIFEMKSAKGIANLCSKLEKDWRSL
jgi:hypothetical protein